MRQQRVLKITIVLVLAVWLGALGLHRFVGPAGPTVAVWMTTRDVAAGMPVDASDVRKQDATADVAAVGPRTSSPIGAGLVFAHAMKAGDALRDDDLVATEQQSSVPITFKRAPDLQSGSYVDVYLVGTTTGALPVGAGASQPGVQLLARHVLVVTGGSNAVIAVPSWQEAMWTAIAASDRVLYAVLSSGIGVPSGNQHVYGVDDAISALTCVAATAAGTAPSCAGASATIGAPAPSSGG